MSGLRSIRDEFTYQRESLGLSIPRISLETGINRDCLYDLENEDRIGFRQLVKLARYFFKEEYHEKMRDWCLQLNTTESIKQAFEYSAIKRDANLLSRLISENKKDPYLKSYISAYSIILDFMTDEISFKEMISKIENLKTSGCKEISLLKQIYQCVSMYYTKDYFEITKEAERISRELSRMKSVRKMFFKECYAYRLSEVLAPAYLHLNELDLCRHHADVMIKTQLNDKHESDGYYYLGISHLAENQEEHCLHFLRKSVEAARKTGESLIINEAEHNLTLAEIYFHFKKSGDIPNTSLLSKQMLLGGDDDFIVFFDYVKAQSVDKIYRGYGHFFKKMNFFFASLIADVLPSLGIDNRQVSELKSFKFEKKGEVLYEESFIDGISFRGDSCSFAS
ncbi:AimR family lysis-lysogeny pheromone receptor [Bacillus licheniformis]|uniref:AimR family lysis-lysogeny pheromone receptor n=1 Tax=Bacillus licheniformis TaxID=1402 RepID=UPI002DBA5F9A|nr:AimR family lysis-lysogeny pheromone receptor [Bacillus licheniformis]MEC0478934.1 AimR family lysis-lysogeny pheromone receptor [Bacillus licheniformis]